MTAFRTRPSGVTDVPAPLLLHVFPSFAVGGAQARFAILANAFGARYRHAVIGMDGNRACATRLAATLDVSFPDIAIRKGDPLGNAGRFRKLLKQLRPDVLVTSNWGSIEWSVANATIGIPHLHMEDGFGPEERATQLARRVWARRLLLRRSRVMLPSRNLLRIATTIWRLDERRLHYIPNGVDLARFAAPSRPDDARALVVGTVAALRGEKNLARLIRAFARVRRETASRLVIVGDGGERPRLEAISHELGVADIVTFAGHIDTPQACYAGFDLFALSSDTEQMPLSVIEAMAAGLPVVSTDVGDVRSMVSAENAAHVVPCDETAMADALRLLLRDPAQRLRIGLANRARAESVFDQSVMIEAHLALIERVRTRSKVRNG